MAPACGQLPASPLVLCSLHPDSWLAATVPVYLVLHACAGPSWTPKLAAAVAAGFAALIPPAAPLPLHP